MRLKGILCFLVNMVIFARDISYSFPFNFIGGGVFRRLGNLHYMWICMLFCVIFALLLCIIMFILRGV